MNKLEELVSKALEIAENEKGGIHKIEDDYYCYVEHWESVCVEKECQMYEDYDEFDDCAYSYAEYVTFEVLPKELSDEFELLNISYVDVGVAPYGTSVVVMRKRKNKKKKK